MRGFVAAADKSYLTQEQWSTLQDKLNQVQEPLSDDDYMFDEWNYDYEKLCIKTPYIDPIRWTSTDTVGSGGTFTCGSPTTCESTSTKELLKD